MNRISRHKKGFTLIELMAVIVILAIMAGVALPKYFDYADRAKEASVRGTLGGVRAGIANFYANAAIDGDALYPTDVELGTIGDVMQEPLPDNPYSDDTGTLPNKVHLAILAEVAPRTVKVASSAKKEGWAYYYDNTGGAETFAFWANSDTNSENTW